MKTVILMWNPTISSFKMDEFRKCIKIMDHHDYSDDEDIPGERIDLNWSIWDYKNSIMVIDSL